MTDKTEKAPLEEIIKQTLQIAKISITDMRKTLLDGGAGPETTVREICAVSMAIAMHISAALKDLDLWDDTIPVVASEVALRLDKEVGERIAALREEMNQHAEMKTPDRPAPGPASSQRRVTKVKRGS